MRFNSEADRLVHPQARLIPKIVWDVVFEGGLSDAELMSMQADSLSLQNLTRAYETFQAMHGRFFPKEHNDKRRNAAICLLYAQPLAGQTLIENATALQLSPSDLLFIAVSAERHDMIQSIIKTFPEIKNELTDVFIQASSLGFLSVMENLMAIKPDNVQSMIKAQYYGSFCNAAAHGHLDIMERIMELAPDEVQNMIKAGDDSEYLFPRHYDAFNRAASNGHLHVMKRLMALAPNDVQAMIKANDYGAFREAASSGHIHIMERLMELAPNDVQNMVTATHHYGLTDFHHYAAFDCAASNGHLHVMERLMALAPNKAEDMIKANYYSAFNNAASHGHLHVMERLMELAPNDVQNMVQADQYDGPFVSATSHGHLHVIERLMELAPNKVQTMIKVNDFAAFRFSAQNNHTQIVNRLLLFPSVLAYAEQHEREYGQKYTHSFITQQLNLLRTQQATLETEHTQAVFNVDADKAQLCFYMLRNLIRRNDATLQDDIQFLLSIPAVKALVHTAVTPNQPNELIRLALTTGNQNAAALLLTIPDVRVLAEQNNFYQNELRGGFDLRAIARDNESSMRALSTGEQLRLSSATAHYEPVMKAQGVEPLFQDLCAQLKARYTAHPARIQTGDGRSLDLPFAWNDWSELSKTLSADTRERALQAYYQHKDHTALRYLSKPNLWMAANAAYVNREGTQSWSTFEEYKPLITLLWLAAKDSSSDITVAPTDGYTVETRIDRFIDEIALLGRAHNWDEQRYKMDTQGNLLMDENDNPILEEYDDAQGDKPSCYSGVKRRLFQSVLGHPLLRFLTMDDIKQELRDEVRDYFKQHITTQNLQAIHDAWANLCEPNPYNTLTHASLNELNLPPDTQTAFIERLAVKYPTQFNQEPRFKVYIEQRFKLDSMCPTHASRFGGETNLDGLLALPAATDVSKQSIIKVKMKLGPHGELGQAVIAEIQCLQRGCNNQSLTAWSGSKEKLAAILAAVNALPEISTESLTQNLTNEQSALSQALFRPLATQANGQNPDQTQMQAIQDSLAECQVQVTRMLR